jgi:archaetidylinositol phosphate synthase
MTDTPWDQQLARILVRPLARTPVTPNMVTGTTLVLAFAAAGLFASGDVVAADWAAGLFVLARFMDHFDGELARLKGLSSRFGYYFDYVAGALSFSSLFLGLGIGQRASILGGWAIALGATAAAGALISMFLNLGIDKVQAESTGKEAVGYPAFAGFELEDGIYLLAPITWFGLLTPFFAAAGIGATIYTLWTLWSLLRVRSAGNSRP